MRFALLAALCCAPSLAMAGECLDYDVPVTLTGTYATGMSYGPPYDPELGAEMVEHRFVDLPKPICTNASGFYDAADDVQRVELMPACPGNTVGERLELTGTLFGAHTAHHEAPVLIDCPAR